MTESTEMYLLKIALLRDEDQPVPISRLAEELAISPVSTNQMCRKLAEQDLVAYQPYKGVTLTARGERQAERVIRRRRLWEVFLVEKLHLGLPQAEETACQLEHLTSDEVTDRLSAFLDHPAVCPHNEPIPPGSGTARPPAMRALTSLGAGHRCRIVRVPGDGQGRGFLRAQGIAPGRELTVTAVTAGGAMLVAADSGPVSLSRTLAEGIEVEPSPAASGRGEG